MTDTLANKTAYQIALNNRDTPGFEEMIKETNLSGMASFGSFSGGFTGYFSMLAKTEKTIIDISTSILWTAFLNMTRSVPEERQEATNIALAPITEALTSKMRSHDRSCLKSGEIAHLSHEAGKLSRDAEWLNEENRQAVKDMSVAAVHFWIELHKQETQAREQTLTNM